MWYFTYFCAVLPYIIGNSDAHGKNFSFLFYGKNVKLAPFYDLLSTEIYPNLDKKMAMKISDKYDPDDLFLRHWHRFAEQNQMKQKAIDHEIKNIVKNIRLYSRILANQLFADNIPDIIEKILSLIESRIKRLGQG
jgi:serine/threonine-protein kinase HipA